MGRIVVIDKTVIDQINYGNADAARAMLTLLRGKAEIWMTAATRNQLFREAENRLVTDLGIRSPMQDINSNQYESRFNPGGDASRAVPNKSAGSAALALSRNAEVLTADRVFANTYRGIGGNVAPEGANIPTLKEVKPINLNYNVGRRLLGLRDLNLGSNGRILPPVAPATPPAPPPNGPRSPSGARIMGEVRATRVNPVKAPAAAKSDPVKAPAAAKSNPVKAPTAGTGGPIKAVDEHAPSATGHAKFQGAALTLKGVNFVLQALNNRLQAERFAERWARLKPTVEGTLDADPQLGALIRVYYSRGKGDNESAIEPVNIFQDVRVAYGLTREDALRRFASQSQMTQRGHGDVIIDDSSWYPPRQAVDIRKVPTPFRSAGLATFRPGKEKLTKVKFSIVSGFDDKMQSKEVLNVPAGTSPRFLYLLPPDEITYFDFKYKKAGVEWDMSLAADTSQASTEVWYKGVPVVKLDSWANPSDATAAMVWPADNATATLFKSTTPTDDGGLLKSLNISLMRWVKPEFMQIIEVF